MTPLQSISTDPAASSDGRFHWDVLRLDALHPLVSGNKPFKLSGYLQAAADTGRRGILTFGGAWSNHIHAVAFAARERGLASIGIIRGEPADPLSATLQDAKAAGMQLRFLSRADYRAVRTFGTDDWQLAYPGFLMVPEGGAGVTGVRGAAEIMRLIPEGLYDWIVCACGTGTTLAGLLSQATPGQRLLGVSVLKGHTGLESDIQGWLPAPPRHAGFTINRQFHFGGYAKHDDSLLQFMNRFHADHGIPTDIVYTGKLMYALDVLGRDGYFPPGANVLAIHSGGLQGNRSLSVGQLCY